MKWAVGVTTVPSRRRDLLPQTLDSLARGGFMTPRLFVDSHGQMTHEDFGLPATYRCPPLNVYGNWALALQELFVRDPEAERYAVFQDDILAVRNLRQYLERCRYPDRGNGSPHDGYWNCYLGPSNAEVIPPGDGWHLSNQYGRGALALVFSREAVIKLLSTRSFVEKPVDPVKGWKSVDGAVVTALAQHGYREYVHRPSLVQHAGRVSSMDKRAAATRDSRDAPEHVWPERWQSPCFPGEEWDAMCLLKGK